MSRRPAVLWITVVLSLPFATRTLAAPIVVTVEKPATTGVWRTTYSFIPYTWGRISGLGRTGTIEWSSDRGHSGRTGIGWGVEINGWTARHVPLEPGINVITITATDPAGNSGSTAFTVTRAESGTERFVDCSLAAPGDGSEGSPFNRVQDAIAHSFPGDVLNVRGGPCPEAVQIDRGVSIIGDPAGPPLEFTGTFPWSGNTIEMRGAEHVLLRHMRMGPAGRTFVDDEGAHLGVTLEDVRGGTFEILGGTGGWPEFTTWFTMTRCEDVALASRSLVGEIGLLVEDSSRIPVQLGANGTSIDVTIRRSSLRGFSISDHSWFKVLIEQSDLSGPFLIYQWRFPTILDVTVRDSSFRATPITIARKFCDYPCVAPVNVLFENNVLEDSPVEIEVDEIFMVPGTAPRTMSFRNNLMVGGGVHVGLRRVESEGQGEASFLFDHNTIVGAAAGLRFTALSYLSTPPLWSARVRNNIIAGGDRGIEAHGLDLLTIEAAGNNVYGQTVARYSGDLADLTGLDGNISADPQFVDPSAGAYSLSVGSPCVDAGTTYPGSPSSDILGTPRPLDGDGDGAAEPDIGAWELIADSDADGHTALTDCDDGDPSVHPGAPDLPGNAVDENCDGTRACDPAAGWGSPGLLVRCVTRECDALVEAKAVTWRVCAELVRSAAGPGN